MIFRYYIVEVFMRRTASTSLRSLSVSLPSLCALPTDTKPRSRWWLPWSFSTQPMYCRLLRTLNAQRCTVGPHLSTLKASRESLAFRFGIRSRVGIVNSA